MFYNLTNKYKALIAIFFLVLLTSLWANNIYILVLFSFLTYLIMPLNKWWDNTSILLFCFSVLYSLILLLTNQVLSYFILCAYAIAPVAFYRFGRFLMTIYPDEESRQKILLYILLSFLVSLFILTFKDILAVGLVNLNRAMTGDIASDDALSATYYGLLSAVGIPCIASIFAREQKLSIRLGFIFISLLSLLVVIHLVNRTGLVIAGGVIIISFLYISQKNPNKKLRYIFLVLILGLVILKSGVLNEEIFAAYQAREANSSFDTEEFGGRLQLWTNAVQNLLVYPFGWHQESYAHNFLLDTARACGLLPFILLLISTFSWIKSVIKLCTRNYTPFILLVISINFSMFLSVMVEPVLDCSILYFAIFVMIWGITQSLSKIGN